MSKIANEDLDWIEFHKLLDQAVTHYIIETGNDLVLSSLFDFAAFVNSRRKEQSGEVV